MGLTREVGGKVANVAMEGRLSTDEVSRTSKTRRLTESIYLAGHSASRVFRYSTIGRWPSDVFHGTTHGQLGEPGLERRGKLNESSRCCLYLELSKRQPTPHGDTSQQQQSESKQA